MILRRLAALLVLSLAAGCVPAGSGAIPGDGLTTGGSGWPTDTPTPAAASATSAPILLAAPTATLPPSTLTLPPDTNSHIAALVREVSAERLAESVFALSAIHSRHVNSAAIGDAAEYIRSQLEAAGGRLVVEYGEFPLVWNEVFTTQVNVIATLPGSDPDAGMIVVGAHYDSRTVEIDDHDTAAPGANDNASGTAVVIELARLMANETPRATIVFAAFSAEEVGKVGSTYFVQQALARGDHIRAMIALDTVGNTVGPSGEGMIRVFSADPPESASRQLARYADVIGARYLPGFEVQVQPGIDRPYRYSDHVPFSEAGIPAVRFIEVLEDLNRNHSSLDLPEQLSPAYMQSVGRLALASIANLAWSPDAPGAPGARTDRVAWSEVEGAAGYLLGMRSADSLEFQYVIRVSNSWADWLSVEGWDYVSAAAIGQDGSLSLFSPELRLAP